MGLNNFNKNENTIIKKKHTLYPVEVHCIYFQTVQAQADEKNHTMNVMTQSHKRAHCNNSSVFKVRLKTLDASLKGFYCTLCNQYVKFIYTGLLLFSPGSNAKYFI